MRSSFWGRWEIEHPGWGAGTLWWGALVDANFILSQKLIYGIKEFRVKKLGKGVEVVRRGGEGEWGARYCVRVMTRRLLEEQIAVVVVLERGEKNDAMWHMPHYIHYMCTPYYQSRLNLVSELCLVTFSPLRHEVSLLYFSQNNLLRVITYVCRHCNIKCF